MILPRLIRAGQAHTYLGMSRDRFESEVRPHIKAAPLGPQGVVFDRLDLDAWATQYMTRNGRVGSTDQKESKSWAKKQPDFARGMASITSTGSTSKGVDRFSAALAQAMKPRPSASGMR